MGDQQPPPGSDPGTPPRASPSALALLLPLALAQFIASYAASNMNVAVSNIAHDLQTDVHGVQVTITFFTLTMAALMIPGSKLTDIWGRKRCLIRRLTVYGIGAVIAALAPVLGVLIVGFCAAAFHATRKTAFIGGIVAAVLMVGGIFLLDYLVVTPREQVKMVIDEGVLAIKANDPDHVVALLAPNASTDIQPYVRWAFNTVKFTGARANDLKITINELTSPHSAKAEFYAVLLYQGKNINLPGDRYACRMIITLEKQNQKWLATGYTEKPVVGK